MDDYEITEAKLVQKTKIIKYEYIINIDNDIGDISQYRKICKILRKAKKNDKVIFILNSFGGYVHTIVQLYNHIIDTKAKTEAILYTAYSATAMIALACDKIIVKKFASMMVHSISGGASGKTGEIISQVTFTEKLDKELNEKIYKTFLTDKEMKEVIKGKDFWFSEIELKKRLKKWVPIRRR